MKAEKLLEMMESEEYKSLTAQEFAKIFRKVESELKEGAKITTVQTHSTKEDTSPIGSNPFMEC